jgi:glycosyltransferase involved in cell wall biosynthesis
LKVAIVHPWFLEAGGAEKVADVLADMYPDAAIFTLSVDPDILSPNLRNRKIFTSNLHKVLLHCGFLRNYLFPLYPWAVESLDVSEYDLIISSCPPVMGLNVRQDAVHICYCHTPQHSWWDSYAEHQAKLRGLTKHVFVLAAVFHRMWEFSAMQRIDYVVANSNYVARRIFKYFRRQSTVIFPPVNTSMGYLDSNRDDYYLSVSRLTTSKRIDLLILACNQIKRRLLIVGTGARRKELEAIAGPTIEFCGGVSDAELPALYAKCRAFVFASDEDFGIAPVEAQSFGRPVIAYGRGGSLETVRVGDSSGSSDTGVFFPAQTVESVVDAILRFEARESSFNPAEIQQHARQFDTAVFVNRMRQFADDALQNG